jgi:IS30 family transposase
MKKEWIIKSNINRRKIKNKSILIHYYIIKNYPTRKIAKILKVHNSTISRTLKRMNIKTQYNLKINKKSVYKLYNSHNFSMEKIARRFNCSRSVIFRILKELSIKIRPKEFYSKANRNGRWLGGKSFKIYSYKWTKELKEHIRNRDNYRCKKCNKFGNHVHHVNYNKQNCKMDNLITLCRKCHIATNSNRDYWYAYFVYITRK